ncbi:CAP domain-containing protein [Pedobacter sp. MR22-3]|uniref:CAP domain-containing protein n=1 Tax=Pedobacter sp. MR22-3 TaxID=2994552 RepID=UPI00224537F7|nr:CAP domain-containing protein [Pedobacter sp. MR22-3]MCX2582466.1 CAP domain-containing protein [Pedobacter sp. MR22-3]
MKPIICCMLCCIIFLQCKKDVIALPLQDFNLVLEKINLLRQSGCTCGGDYMPPVAPLSLNSQLESAAMAHAKDMDQRNYFEHISPEGITPQERAFKAGYKGNVEGENLGKGYVNADEVINAWKKSASHCKAMMDANSNEAGIGFSENYWAISFGASL